MLVPDAMMIGPMKAGTTWAYEYLKSRGDVCMPKGVKETFFFDRHYERDIEWYKAHFTYCENERYQRIMEVAPSCFHCPDAPKRINKILGKIRLVVVLRDPVKRSWSHYLHLLRYGYTSEPFHIAVRKFPEILEASRYDTQLKRWRRVFGDQIQVLFLEDLEANMENYCRKLCDALQLRFILPESTSNERTNVATVAPSQWLAKAGRTIANSLRHRRMYFVVNIAKSLGLKRIFFGRRITSLPEPGEAESTWLIQQLQPEMQALQEEFGDRLSGWQSFN